jgi:glucose-6-phosphate 1-dehydrogenase
MSSTAKKPQAHLLVIFGASGDLTYRKLIPALRDLYAEKLLPDDFAVLGVGRTELTDSAFRDKVQEGIRKFSRFARDGQDPDDEKTFLRKLHYLPIDTGDQEQYGLLKQRMSELDTRYRTGGNCIFYLATPPALYERIPAYLAAHRLNLEGAGSGWKRIIIEKPFGTDLESGRALNRRLLDFFREDQLYRIDHYLGKETVQNLLVTRFANGIFEPLWNRNYVHHIEITTAESLGVEGREGYYDASGALRDMVQNHLLQVAALVAMEPPTVIEATAIRNETLKVFQALKPYTPETAMEQVIRGQYGPAHVRGQYLPGYREETGVPENSRTETYVALKFYIDNWRWGGVPFYIRTGKRLPTRVSEVVIHFKPTPHTLFVENKEFCNQGNQLIIRIQPDEGILLKFGMKVPGSGFQVNTVNMDFRYSDLQETVVPEAYERLLLDCMQGDATLYARGDAVESAWAFVQPVLDHWAGHRDVPLYGYPSGTWGPEQADALIEGKQAAWRYPCRNLAEDGLYCEL